MLTAVLLAYDSVSWFDARYCAYLLFPASGGSSAADDSSAMIGNGASVLMVASADMVGLGPCSSLYFYHLAGRA